MINTIYIRNNNNLAFVYLLTHQYLFINTE